MKNAIMILLVFTISTLAVSAQSSDKKTRDDRKEMREKTKSWSPQQRAELQTKKMALHLDLTEAQQSKVYPIQLEMAKKRMAMYTERKAKTEITSEELFEMKKSRLEERLQIKKQFQSILTPEQFEKWEKTHHQGRNKNHRKGRSHGR